MRASQLPTIRRAPGRAAAANHPPANQQLVLERYRLQRRLGQGGFGTVWQARDERLERDVAVKVFDRHWIVGGRFEREAHVAASLDHPAIVTLYEAAVDDDGAYLVSELVRGATLDQLLDAGRLSDRDIVALGLALCDALEHAHARNVIHRDVKPSNILVPERPASSAALAKLTDFGVARVLGADALTRTGDVVGTLAYMAPEQAEGLPAGATADLYSLALVLYEALTGINPVRTNSAAIRARRLGAYLPPLRRQRRELPRELARAIDLALRPRPRERGSVAELRGALAQTLEEVGDEPGVVTTPWLSSADEAEREARAAPAPHEAQAPTLPMRALAVLAAAGIGAWVTANLFAPGTIPVPFAALAAAVLTAALPRIGWLASSGAAVGLLASQGRAGTALVLALAAAIPAILIWTDGSAWPLPAGSPALAAISLGGAWPALAAHARTVWRRAALGATGWIWLVLMNALTGTSAYLRDLPQIPGPAAWQGSASGAVDHVLAPLISTGVLLPAVIWALAAVSLPLLRASRILAVDLVLVVIWAALVASATGAALALGHNGGLRPGVAALGAVLGGVIALAPQVLWTVRHRRE